MMSHYLENVCVGVRASFAVEMSPWIILYSFHGCPLSIISDGLFVFFLNVQNSSDYLESSACRSGVCGGGVGAGGQKFH